MPQITTITPTVEVGAERPLLIIAGPCQIESREHTLRIASHLHKLTLDRGVNLVFKSSYDKANRTRLNSTRGLGIEEGLRILEEVKKVTGLPVLTDIHTPEEARAAAEVVDILQTPAFLCRQTDLLTAAGETGRAINIKKGQFLPPQDMQFAAEKVASTGNKNVLLCERGTCFGYRDLIVDMRSLLIMREIGYPVIFDATHSVQSMGGAGGSSGGLRDYVAPLVRGALAVGVDGLFIECHEDPDSAPSDGPSMLRLDSMPALLDTIIRFRQAWLETFTNSPK
jgi:2-dehydro-3-deoxyphosphooctonate aldolase (KDO 8-P synthase)